MKATTVAGCIAVIRREADKIRVDNAGGQPFVPTGLLAALDAISVALEELNRSQRLAAKAMVRYSILGPNEKGLLGSLE